MCWALKLFEVLNYVKNVIVQDEACTFRLIIVKYDCPRHEKVGVFCHAIHDTHTHTHCIGRRNRVTHSIHSTHSPFHFWNKRQRQRPQRTSESTFIIIHNWQKKNKRNRRAGSTEIIPKKKNKYHKMMRRENTESDWMAVIRHLFFHALCVVCLLTCWI